MVEPPRDLRAATRWFIVRYAREDGVYHLAVPTTRETFNLGNANRALAYFRRVGLETIGQRALDSATAFGASQALIDEGRAWGLDMTTDKRLPDNLVRQQAREDYDAQLGGIEGDDEPVEAIL